MQGLNRSNAFRDDNKKMPRNRPTLWLISLKEYTDNNNYYSLVYIW